MTIKIQRILFFCAVLFCTSLPATAQVNGFTLPDLQGKQHTLAQYRGKWVIINYWATTCPPCLKEMPDLDRFHRRHRDTDAVVLGVNYEDIKLSWLKDFVESVKITYPVLLGDPDKPTPFGPIVVLPTTVIVSPEGNVKGMQAGAVTAEAIENYIRSQQAATATAGAMDDPGPVNAGKAAPAR